MYLIQNELEQLRRDDSDLEADSGSEPEAPAVGRTLRLGLAALAAVAFVGLAGLHVARQAERSSLRGVEVKAGLYSNGAFNQLPADAAPVAPAVTAVAAAASKHVPLNPNITSVNQLTGGTKGLKVSAASSNPMAPDENLADGNTCCDDEELFEGMCYKKCSILTNGDYAARISGFTCAKSAQLTDVFNSRSESFIPCNGFDVAGDECGKGCPHQAGACLVTEEMFLGKCFKKCTDLTAKQYPFRTSAATCCKSKNFMECFSPLESKISAEYNVGGGVTDKEEAPHSPEVALTEATR